MRTGSREKYVIIFHCFKNYLQEIRIKCSLVVLINLILSFSNVAEECGKY